MKNIPSRRIRSATPRSGYQLTIVWDDGNEATVDFAPAIDRGGVFAPLHDQEKFARLRIDVRGRKIFWPEPIDLNGDPVIDIDADGLHAMAQS